MLHPSYTELMAVVNSEIEEGEQPLVQSRYSIVKATANRAKEIIAARTIEERLAKSPEGKDGRIDESSLTKDEARTLDIGQPLIAHANNMKPLSIAVEELYEGKIKITSNGDENEKM